MRSVLIAAVLCMALLAAPVIAHGDHGDHSHDDASDVVVLDPTSFDAEVGSASEAITLVEFFAPWCGHCKSLAPNFARAATELKGTAKLASVDCTVHKDLCSRYGVQGFPTLKVFRQGGDINKPADYQGGRTDKDIVKYLRKQTEPAYVEISSADELSTLRARDGIEIVGVFSSLDSEEAKTFIAVANELRNDFTFAVSTNSAVGSVGSISLYKGDASEPAVVTSEADVISSADKIKTWIQAEAFELVGEIGPENFQKYLDRGLPLVWCFIDMKSADNGVLSQITEAAKSVKGQLSVVKLDGVRWAEHAKHFGLVPSKLPGIVVEDRNNNKNYIFNQDSEVTSSALAQHLKSFLAGELKANLKTQAEPTDNNGPVKVLVGSNFENIVINQDDKDVFVEFYAPWCGHCKSLAPKWDLLGEEFASDSNIVIAKVDATENDTPAKIEGFPTLILYPAGAKDSPITFDGDRSVEAMVAWIKENRKSAPATGANATPAAATEEAGHEDL